MENKCTFVSITIIQILEYTSFIIQKMKPKRVITQNFHVFLHENPVTVIKYFMHSLSSLLYVINTACKVCYIIIKKITGNILSNPHVLRFFMKPVYYTKCNFNF